MPRNYKFVGKKIEKYIPVVRQRNREALLQVGSEPCLLYLPDGFVDNAEWDDVRQTYRNQDIKYKLYLNRNFYGCERLYGNDTNLVPSILMAFPSTPESISHREDGLYNINRSNAWTLWEPILPVKGAIVVRKTLHNETELYLLESVTHSYFPTNLVKSGLHLLHQETPVVRIEDNTLLSLNSLPSVEDSLAIFKNDLLFSLDGLSVSGTGTPSLDGTPLNGSLTTNSSFLEVKVKINFTLVNSNNLFSIEWGSLNNLNKLKFEASQTDNTFSLFIGTLLVKQQPLILNNDQDYELKIELTTNIYTVWLDNIVIFKVYLKLINDYTNNLPLSSSPIILNSNTDILLKNLYVMEII